ncbi:hypothetical protein [Thermosipho atlanticus]|nr:hypothetical protein [Thermosipho atlanticus]
MKVLLVNIDQEKLKSFLGVPIECVSIESFNEISCKSTGNLFFIYTDTDVNIPGEYDVKVIKKNNEITVMFDREYTISLNSGDYHLLDFKTDGTIYRYIFKIGDTKGIYVLKNKLNEDEILHFLLSLFVIEKIL